MWSGVAHFKNPPCWKSKKKNGHHQPATWSAGSMNRRSTPLRGCDSTGRPPPFWLGAPWPDGLVVASPSSRASPKIYPWRIPHVQIPARTISRLAAIFLRLPPVPKGQATSHKRLRFIEYWTHCCMFPNTSKYVVFTCKCLHWILNPTKWYSFTNPDQCWHSCVLEVNMAYRRWISWGLYSTDTCRKNQCF